MRTFLRLVLVVLVLAAVVWAVRRLDLLRYLSVDGMRALVDAHAPYGPLVFMGLVVTAIFTHVPFAAQLSIAAGAIVLGAPAAFVYGWLAGFVGATSTFLLVRYGARAPVERALSGRLARLRAYDERLTQNGFWTVLALRCLFFFAPPLNWELGLTGVRVRDYLAATALGVLPLLATTVLFAGSLAAGSGDASRKVVIGAVLAIAVLTVAGVARRYLRGKPSASPT